MSAHADHARAGPRGERKLGEERRERDDALCRPLEAHGLPEVVAHHDFGGCGPREKRERRGGEAPQRGCTTRGSVTVTTPIASRNAFALAFSTKLSTSGPSVSGGSARSMLIAADCGS